MKETIETFDKDKNPIKLDIRHPSGQQLAEGRMIYASEWNKAIEKGCILRIKLQETLVKHGVWSEDKIKQEESIGEEMIRLRRKIKGGGIKKGEAQEAAMKLFELRNELRDLLLQKNKLEENTAEAYADNANFDYLTSVCTLNNKDGSLYFKSYENYLERKSEQAAIDAASKLFGMLYDVKDDSWQELPEIKFMRQFKMMDENGYLLNKEGQRTDRDGRLIDDQGRYIDGKGGFQDRYGNPVDDKGEELVEFKPFLDDDGQPILD